MYGKFQQYLQDELKAIEEAGLYKKERNIVSSQSAEITLEDGSRPLTSAPTTTWAWPTARAW